MKKLAFILIFCFILAGPAAAEEPPDNFDGEEWLQEFDEPGGLGDEFDTTEAEAEALAEEQAKKEKESPEDASIADADESEEAKEESGKVLKLEEKGWYGQMGNESWYWQVNKEGSKMQDSEK